MTPNNTHQAHSNARQAHSNARQAHSNARQARTARATTRKSIRLVSIALVSLLGLQAGAVFAGPVRGKAGDRQRVERAHDRRDDRQDFREDRRDDRQDFREDRRDDRQDFREDRRDDRHDRHHHHWRHHRWETWDDWRDYRRTVAAARLVAGMIFATLPHDHTVIVIHGSTYYVHEDAYFVKVVDGGVTSYEVVNPPIGAVVHALPEGHQTVVIHGNSYFTHGGLYYRPHGTSFIVVAQP